MSFLEISLFDCVVFAIFGLYTEIWLIGSLCFFLCGFVVTMQAQKEAPPDMQCRDKFLVQSVIAPEGATNKDVTPEMVG